MLEIKKMTEKHIFGISEIEKRYFKDPWSYEMIKSELENPFAYYFVCEDKGKVSGYIGMYITVDTVNITNIAVCDENRRKGIGNALLKKVVSLSLEMNMSFVTLEVRVSNAPAISLYEKNGFKIVGKRKEYYSDNKEDAYIMTLALEY